MHLSSSCVSDILSFRCFSTLFFAKSPEFLTTNKLRKVAMAQLLRCYPLAGQNANAHFNLNRPVPATPSPQNDLPFNPSSGLLRLKPLSAPSFRVSFAATAGGGVGGFGGAGKDGGGGGGRGDGDSSSSDDSKSFLDSFGPVGAFLSGWRSRVAADPQFPFKVLMEEVVGVSSNVLGDMASRPNFGLNELDFVFSTLVVGSIVNFVLMYILAPTASSSSQSLPSIFANSPTSHMFEPGPYSLLDRFGTFVYKGILFAAVGFAAGLAGTAISNGLIKMRKKMDPNFEPPNKPPPTVLNATTWALHMGVNSNLRYQTLNSIEFLLEKYVHPVVFKSSIIVLRCFNNLLGGMTFVMLARVTGSQGVNESKVLLAEDGTFCSEKDKLLNEYNLKSNEASSSK